MDLDSSALFDDQRIAHVGAGRYAHHDIGSAPAALGPAVRAFLLAPPGGSR